MRTDKSEPGFGLTEALSNLWTAIILNFLWLLLCVPVVTAGASTYACYETTRKRIIKGEGQLFSTFFRAFKSNFRQSTALGLIGMAVLAACVFTWIIASSQDSIILYIPLVVEVLFFASVFFWCIPLSARFENKTWQQFRNGLLLSLGHLWSTLLLVLSLALVVLIIWYAFVFIFILPMVVMTLWTMRLEKILIKNGFVEKEE